MGTVGLCAMHVNPNHVLKCHLFVDVSFLSRSAEDGKQDCDDR